VIFNDSLKIERITDRVRTLESGSRFFAEQSGRAERKAQSSKVEVRMVRDTVYVERVDTIEVQKLQGTSSSLNPRASGLNYLKWIFWILVAGIVLIIVVKLKIES